MKERDENSRATSLRALVGDGEGEGPECVGGGSLSRLYWYCVGY